MACELCRPHTVLHHLIVVPDFWKGMMGDDWLNNAWTRDIYGDYIETQLQNEIDEHIEATAQQAQARELDYRPRVILGKPTECLLQTADAQHADVVVIGSPRPKGVPGYRSRMHTAALVKALKVPLLIAPYPQ